MINVSDAWKDIQPRFLLPESYIEINCMITEAGAQESATVAGHNEIDFSNASTVLDVNRDLKPKYATNELNLWALDGSCDILPDSGKDDGYVGSIEHTGSITLSFPVIRTAAVSGITIVWGSRYGEYPRIFTVTAKNGSTAVAETTITDNDDQVSEVFMEMQNYDSIVITVHQWYLNNRRVRIEKVTIGHTLTFTKDDLLSFTHEQHGDILSGEVPKNSIEFTLNNVDNRWNPTNPFGMAQYLTEQQKITVRYGLDVNGVPEWINAGTFYLTEWHAPSNGLEARFVARDALGFLLNKEIKETADGTSTQTGNLTSIARWAIGNLPSGSSVVISIPASPTRDWEAKGNLAAIVQKCANAGCCIMRTSRDGVLYIEPLNKTDSGYRIPLSLSYSFPEIELAKPLKEVEVDYGGDAPYLHGVARDGETQTLTNELIYNEDTAKSVGAWVGDVLKNRKIVSGEFRADPRLDLFDIVSVESKFGILTPVVITNIKYVFEGSFKGSYTGRVLEV